MGRSNHPWIEDRDPIFIFRMPANHRTEDLIAACQETERLCATAPGPYVVISALGNLSRSTAGERAFVGKSNERVHAMPTVKKYCLGMAIVLTNPFQRGVVTALEWFSRRPFPSTVVSSEAEALAWVTAKLRAANIPVLDAREHTAA
jgi:hypothetical protein